MHKKIIDAFDMQPQKITPRNWRFKVAQFVLGVLYGRKWHYISPWRGAGIGSGVVMMHDNKVLMGIRRGRIEHSGKWGIVGGFLDLEAEERIGESLVRETEEESKVRLDALKINDQAIVHIELAYKQHKLEQENACTFGIYYKYQLSDREKEMVGETAEMSDFTFFTEKEIDDMWEKGILAYGIEYNAIKEAFKQPNN